MEAQRSEYKATFEQVKAQPNLNRLAAAALATAQQGMGSRGASGGGFDDFDGEEGLGFPGRKMAGMGGRLKRRTRDATRLRHK